MPGSMQKRNYNVTIAEPSSGTVTGPSFAAGGTYSVDSGTTALPTIEYAFQDISGNMAPGCNWAAVSTVNPIATGTWATQVSNAPDGGWQFVVRETVTNSQGQSTQSFADVGVSVAPNPPNMGSQSLRQDVDPCSLTIYNGGALGECMWTTRWTAEQQPIEYYSMLGECSPADSVTFESSLWYVNHPRGQRIPATFVGIDAQSTWRARFFDHPFGTAPTDVNTGTYIFVIKITSGTYTRSASMIISIDQVL